MNVRTLQKNALLTTLSPSNSNIGDSKPQIEETFINYIEFNQYQTCFCVGTQIGFSIFNIEPLKLRADKKFTKSEKSSKTKKNFVSSHKTNLSNGSVKSDDPGSSPKTSPRNNQTDNKSSDDEEDDEDDIEDVEEYQQVTTEELLDDEDDEKDKSKRRKSKSSSISTSSAAQFSKFSVNPSFSGVGIIEPLFNSQICALVGGGSSPFRTPKDLVIWDLSSQTEKCILHFENEILNVKLQKDLIIVVFEHSIRFFDFNLNETRKDITTIENPKGIIAVNSDSTNLILACLGLIKGQVRLEKLSNTSMKKFQVSEIEKTQSNDSDLHSDNEKRESSILKIIPAHINSIECLALSKDGTILATASENGTLIRIFSTSCLSDQNSASCNMSAPLKILRRGSFSSYIVSLAIRDDNKLLCCSSITGTIHLFSLEDKEKQEKFKKPLENFWDSPDPYNLQFTEFSNQTGWFGQSGETSIHKHHGIPDGSLVCFKPISAKPTKGFTRSPTFENQQQQPSGNDASSCSEISELKQADVYAITPNGVFHKITFYPDRQTKEVKESFYEQLYK